MDSNELILAAQNRPDRTETGHTTGHESVCPVSKAPTRLPKDHQDYWRSRLRKRSFLGRDGKQNEIPEWQVRMFHVGKEGWFNLGTANKTIASAKARDIYLSLIDGGWGPTLAKFKPSVEVKSLYTVGDYLAQVKTVGGLKPGTFEIYASKFRTLIAQIFGLRGDKSKNDHVHGGYQKWQERVHAVRLARLTPKRITSWRVKYLQDAATDPLCLKRATRTVNTIVRCSKALFSPKVVKNLSGELPSPLPFNDIKLLKQPKNRYRSEINPHQLLMQAKRELAGAKLPKFDENVKPHKLKEAQCEVGYKREAYKVLLLALGAGLRRDEIDTLTWNQLDFSSNTITVETNIYTEAKSEESEAAVDVDPGLMEIFKAYMASSQSKFVINSPNEPRPMAATYHHYRCHRLFRKLNDWLRTKGVTSRMPLHALRKEYGSQICKQAGIFAASVNLRHSNIQITRDHYLDKKAPTVFKIGNFMEAQATDEPERQDLSIPK